MRTVRTAFVVFVYALAATLSGVGAHVLAAESAAGDVSNMAGLALDYWPLADGNRWRFSGAGLDMLLVAVELGPGEFRVDGFSNDFHVQREFYQVIDGDIVTTRREQPGGV